MYQKGRAWIEIDLSCLQHNVAQFQELLGEKSQLMPAVKANAYGHGALQIARALQDMGIYAFCVASALEGKELRKAGIKGEILVLGYTHPDLFEVLWEYQLTQTIVDADYAKVLCGYGKKLSVELAIDTGMHRLGIRSDAITELIKIWSYPNLQVAGVFSHLCVSDCNTLQEKAYTHRQLKNYDAAIQKLHAVGIRDFHTHIQSSYGLLNAPKLRYDYVRVGIALYGVLSTKEDCPVAQILLKPVLSLKSRIVSIKELHQGEYAGYGMTYQASQERKIAIVSIGYADGIPRSLSNRGNVLIRGKKVPIVGRICMDQLTVDVSDLEQVAVGEEVTLIGTSDNQTLGVEEMAAGAETISNEILSRLGQRLEIVQKRTAVQLGYNLLKYPITP